MCVCECVWEKERVRERKRERERKRKRERERERERGDRERERAKEWGEKDKVWRRERDIIKIIRIISLQKGWISQDRAMNKESSVLKKKHFSCDWGQSWKFSVLCETLRLLHTMYG